MAEREIGVAGRPGGSAGPRAAISGQRPVAR